MSWSGSSNLTANTASSTSTTIMVPPPWACLSPCGSEISLDWSPLGRTIPASSFRGPIKILSVAQGGTTSSSCNIASAGKLLHHPFSTAARQEFTLNQPHRVSSTTHTVHSSTIDPASVQAATVGHAYSLKAMRFAPTHHSSSSTTHQPSYSQYAEQVRNAHRVDGTATGRGTGLRMFAMKVCEKVRQRKVTTYNEVADELVEEMAQSGIGTHFPLSHNALLDQQAEQKNIRRRVYDALNVLMAMNIIMKDKKDLHWLGLPLTSHVELGKLETERSELLSRIREKTQRVQNLILQKIAVKNLIDRNREQAARVGMPSEQSILRLPFILISTEKDTVVDCSVADDRSEYVFKFDNTFEVDDDAQVLDRLGLTYGLGKPNSETLTEIDIQRCGSAVPPALHRHVQEMAGLVTPAADSIAEMAVCIYKTRHKDEAANRSAQPSAPSSSSTSSNRTLKRLTSVDIQNLEEYDITSSATNAQSTAPTRKKGRLS